MNTIEVTNLKRQYKTYKRGEGLLEAVKSLFKRDRIIKHALRGIDMKVKRGEIIGFVGSNGAGKSTTIKILTGLLYPSSGEVSVLGLKPWEDRKQYVAQIGAVFGQKSQLWWDLPPIDSFYLSKGLYKIPEAAFEERMRAMVKMLNVEEVIHRPTRQLSLGERMKCEAIMAFLHRPKIVFLDEPTIGLDALAKEELRHFLKAINRKEKTTIILTTHDMDDIEELCKRIIIIDQGAIIFDGNLETVKKKYIKWQTVEFEYLEVKNKRSFESALKKGKINVKKHHYVSIRFNKTKVDVPEMIEKLMKSVSIVDLKVHEPRLEQVIKEIYSEQ